jgi:hypothetical protein
MYILKNLGHCITVFVHIKSYKMDLKVKEIFRHEIILVILSLTIYSLCIHWIKIIIKYLLNYDTALDIFITICIPSIILVIYELKRRLKTQLHNPLYDIKSKLLQKKAFEFSKESVIKISSTFCTLLLNENKNILWELEHIELKELEQTCLNGNIIIDKDKLCNTIYTCIKKQRRIRITTIADSLILRNSFFIKNEYYATETRLPSCIIDDDRGYYEKQRNYLLKYKTKKACRLLILKKTDIIQELKEKKKFLEDFIVNNNVEYEKGKTLQLKIIVYNNVLEDVFSDVSLDSYYDFVISKKGKKTTVFAQNEKNVLALYDSSNENHQKETELFCKAFDDLFNHENTSIDITYSNLIKTIKDAEDFIIPLIERK